MQQRKKLGEGMRGIKRWLHYGFVCEGVSRCFCIRGRHDCERNEDLNVTELLVGLWVSLQVFVWRQMARNCNTSLWRYKKNCPPVFKIGQFIVTWFVRFLFSTCNQVCMYTMLYWRIYRHILCLLCTGWKHTCYTVFQIDHITFCCERNA